MDQRDAVRAAPDRAWRLVAFLASAGAAGVHFGAARMHVAEYAPAGLFMLVAGVAQLVWAVWVASGAPLRVLEAGIAGNVAIAALWVATRTAGLPVGPTPGMPEHVHGPDALATVLELIVVVSAIALAGDRVPRLEPVLARLACAASVLTVVVAGDDPAHERLVAAATLVLAGAVRLLVAAAPRSIVRHERRSHVEVPLAGRLAAGLRAAGAGVGARG